MKAVWQGSISFGLVNIPISLFTAVQAHSLGFTLLCGICNNPISYKRWCDNCEKEVAWESVVKGLKLKNDTYFVLTQDNLKAIKPLTTESLTITEFVDVGLINPIYFDKHYYVAPQKQKEKAYFLFVNALNTTQKAAIGTFIMKDKEHVCAITPYKHALLLTTLHYSYEINDVHDIETLKAVPKLTSQEVSLAVDLIEQLTQKTFEMNIYKDTFAQRLKAFLQSHAHRKKTRAKKSRALLNGKTSASLMSSLQKSIIHAKRASQGARARKR